ncbi:hypothetical protein [Dactylosporangium sp. NPDC051541]|uniref:hypothetical protein n=1 Tax=Dactylosporangium sp. NPDC051541 TaxID=3363977 RepID=UPI00378BD6A3
MDVLHRVKFPTPGPQLPTPAPSSQLAAPGTFGGPGLDGGGMEALTRAKSPGPQPSPPDPQLSGLRTVAGPARKEAAWTP